MYSKNILSTNLSKSTDHNQILSNKRTGRHTVKNPLRIITGWMATIVSAKHSRLSSHLDIGEPLVDTIQVDEVTSIVNGELS